jgi:hypothetical protein
MWSLKTLLNGTAAKSTSCTLDLVTRSIRIGHVSVLFGTGKFVDLEHACARPTLNGTHSGHFQPEAAPATGILRKIYFIAHIRDLRKSGRPQIASLSAFTMAVRTRKSNETISMLQANILHG